MLRQVKKKEFFFFNVETSIIEKMDGTMGVRNSTQNVKNK